ncbi:MAG: FAD binding domain-containing protein, partial [Burkholderiaceae bacterium]
VQVSGPQGERQIPFEQFHRLPGESPELDNTLQRDEIITAIDLPAEGFADHHQYLKVRDRHSYAFALVSVAVGLKVDGDRITEARLALGGVAHKPWRDREAEAMLAGAQADQKTFAEVARFLVRGARGYESNSFKVELAQRAVVRALEQALGRERR